LGSWRRRERVVQLMEILHSRMMGIYAIHSIGGEITEKDKRDARLYSKYLRWLKRIYAGLWPWR